VRRAPRRSGPCSWLSSAALLLVCAGGVRAQGEVRGRIVADRFAPAVVYASDLPDATASPHARATLKQRHLQFVPQVLPVLQGTTVEFANEDATAHNVFSPSAPDPFDLGTFGEGIRTHLFREPGPRVILCNVHVEMVAWILVLRNPHFVAVDGQGQFALKLPPGRHRLVLWRPREPELKKEVEVPTDGKIDLDWDVDERVP
jgi:plastocyanin